MEKLNIKLLKAGVGRTNVTPDMGVRLGGYGIKDRPAEKVLDPLHATALVLEQVGIKVAIINLDWICIDEKDTATIRALVNEITGIKKEYISVCTTHSHSTPNTLSAWGWGDKEFDYIEKAIPLIAKSVKLANENLQPVKVGIATTECKAGVNRRGINEQHDTGGFIADPIGSYDPTMTVIRFEAENDSVCSIVHYGAHGTAMGCTRDVTRDWMGVMKDRIESQTNAPVVFINGAIGDVGPRTNVLRSYGFCAGGGDGYTAVTEVGLRAASDALWAHYSIKEWHESLKLSVTVEDITLPYAKLPDLEEAQEELIKIEAPALDEWGEKMCEYKYWNAVIDAHQREILMERKFTQTIIQLGPIVFIPFPGELFSGISLRLRAYSPFQYTLCSSVSNGSLGYLPTREARHRGGYETWVGRAYGAYQLAEDIDDHLVEQNLNLLRKVYK